MSPFLVVQVLGNQLKISFSLSSLVRENTLDQMAVAKVILMAPMILVVYWHNWVYHQLLTINNRHHWL